MIMFRTRFLDHVLLGVLAVSFGSALPCGAAPPQDALNIVDFGAAPDDGSDDLEAIRACISAAAETNRPVYIPAGRFHIGDAIDLDGVHLVGAGPESVLHGLNPLRRAIRLFGEAPEVRALTLTTDNPPARRKGTDNYSSGVRVFKGCRNFRIEDLVIEKTTKVGVFCAEAHHGIVRNNVIRETLADGIHFTAAAHDIVIEHNIVEDTGDDTIALVGYKSADQPLRNIIIRNNRTARGDARGISILGVENAVVEGNVLRDIAGAALYIATEGNYDTHPNTNILVRGNDVYNATCRPGSGTKGGILLQATNIDDPAILNAVFIDNRIFSANTDAIVITGGRRIFARFENNLVADAKAHGINVLPKTRGRVTFENNTVRNAGGQAYALRSRRMRIFVDGEERGGTPAAAKGDADAAAIQCTPFIDGKLDACWEEATPIQLSTDRFGVTGSCRLAWDEDHLYAYVDIADPTLHAAVPVNLKKGQNHNDSVELWVDENNDKSGNIRKTSYHLRIDLNASVSSNWGYKTDRVRTKVARRETGYVVEVAVPFKDITPRAGARIGLNVTANNEQTGDGRRDTFISWVDPRIPYWGDAALFNTVVLTRN